LLVATSTSFFFTDNARSSFPFFFFLFLPFCQPVTTLLIRSGNYALFFYNRASLFCSSPLFSFSYAGPNHELSSFLVPKKSSFFLPSPLRGSCLNFFFSSFFIRRGGRSLFFSFLFPFRKGTLRLFGACRSPPFSLRVEFATQTIVFPPFFSPRQPPAHSFFFSSGGVGSLFFWTCVFDETRSPSRFPSFAFHLFCWLCSLSPSFSLYSLLLPFFFFFLSNRPEVLQNSPPLLLLPPFSLYSRGLRYGFSPNYQAPPPLTRPPCFDSPFFFCHAKPRSPFLYERTDFLNPVDR